MTDAVADYGLRLELTRVLLQLRNVQLQALDDPMYRALVSRIAASSRVPTSNARVLLFALFRYVASALATGGWRRGKKQRPRRRHRDP